MLEIIHFFTCSNLHDHKIRNRKSHLVSRLKMAVVFHIMTINIYWQIILSVTMQSFEHFADDYTPTTRVLIRYETGKLTLPPDRKLIYYDN